MLAHRQPGNNYMQHIRDCVTPICYELYIRLNFNIKQLTKKNSYADITKELNFLFVHKLKQKCFFRREKTNMLLTNIKQASLLFKIAETGF